LDKLELDKQRAKKEFDNAKGALDKAEQAMEDERQRLIKLQLLQQALNRGELPAEKAAICDKLPNKFRSGCRAATLKGMKEEVANQITTQEQLFTAAHNKYVGTAKTYRDKRKAYNDIRFEIQKAKLDAPDLSKLPEMQSRVKDITTQLSTIQGEIDGLPEKRNKLDYALKEIEKDLRTKEFEIDQAKDYEKRLEEAMKQAQKQGGDKGGKGGQSGSGKGSQGEEKGEEAEDDDEPQAAARNQANNYGSPGKKTNDQAGKSYDARKAVLTQSLSTAKEQAENMKKNVSVSIEGGGSASEARNRITEDSKKQLELARALIEHTQALYQTDKTKAEQDFDDKLRKDIKLYADLLQDILVAMKIGAKDLPADAIKNMDQAVSKLLDLITQKEKKTKSKRKNR
jgi:hypothetical protein